MNAMNVACKLVSTIRVAVLVVLIALPLNAAAEYYLVYESPMVCGGCEAHRVYYRPSHRVHRVHCACARSHHRYYHRYYRAVCHRRSHYSIAAYYPVPVYSRPRCGCCGCDGFLEPTYYWTSAPYRVYYARPSDRLVGNRYYYDDSYYDDPSLDTGTADNDIQ
ncbi:MAG TPA: hypothetical protein VLJ15_03910 [Gammaproteobacteria bacterium]|nr:hypothetical protein [Gammaproteobacteria bacterium]